MTTQPLAGIRVLDLTNVLAGPFACHQLAHLGAEVIKVEAVGRGDLARNLGSDLDLNAAGMGISFLAQNAGKKSVTLNLKHPDGKALLKRLVSTADVLVENFRPGVMARLDLDYPQLKAVQPSLIYCAISGFGQDGPWVSRPAYDQIIQGASGLMSVTGDADSAPLRVGSPIADTIGGLTAAMAINAALNARPRGCLIDVSMLEGLLSTMGWVLSNFLIGGQPPAPTAMKTRPRRLRAPSAPAKACSTSPPTRTSSGRRCARISGGAICSNTRIMPAASSARPTATSCARRSKTASRQISRQRGRELNALGIPSGAVLSVEEVLASEQLAARDFLEGFAASASLDCDIQVVSTGVKIDGTRPKVETPPPALGAHAAEIWGELGFSEAELEDLQQRGVI